MRTLPLVLLALLAIAPAARAAQPPEITGVTVTDRGTDRLVVVGYVNPHGADTSVHLQFGATQELGASSTEVAVPAGEQPVLVTITLTGLRPRTTYFFRFTAVNAAGPVASDVASASTQPLPPAARVVPVARVSFAIRLGGGRGLLGRLLAATRPEGLPAGTLVTIRCRSGCRGGRSFHTRARESGTVRFRPPIGVTPRSVIEIRATHAGYLGRMRRFVFRRSGLIVVPRRVADVCLAAGSQSRRAACPR